jgi:TolB protein
LAVVIGTLAILRKNPDLTLQLIPFTTYPGGQYEPAFSSDGTRVAFVWDNENAEIFNVYTKPGGAAEARKLIASTREDRSPQYSPDGAKIALRSDRSASRDIHT